MIELSEGALDAIMAGDTIENPILQILGHKKLASTSGGERYRLLLSDGRRINSFTMLATQLNDLVSTELTEFTVCEITRYAMSNVNNGGKQKKVMVVLGIDVKVPGHEVGRKIGNPSQLDSVSAETEPASNASEKKPPAVEKKTAPNKPSNNTGQKTKLDVSVSSGSDITTTPIAALSPYQNRWVIKARVSNKSAVRTWSNARGEGKLFSMDLVDESGEIRCTAFKNEVDKFFDMIEIGKVYYISRCTMKPANKQYTTLKNDYEMTMNNDTEIVACHDEVDDIPALAFDFQPLSSVESAEKNTMLDVLGIVKSYGEVQSLTAKASGRELHKRDVQIVDMSRVQVTLTLWGSQAEDFNAQDNPVIAIKGVRIGEFNGGKSLSTVGSSLIQLDPDIPEAHRLRGWWKSEGRDQDCKVVASSGGAGGANAPIMTLEDAANKCLELTDGVEIYTVKGCIGLIRHDNAMYKSCPMESCNKKLVDQANGMYRCEKCNREFPNYRFRLLLSISISDWTGNQWVTAFNDEAEKILGHSAQELGEIKESNADAYEAIFTKATFEQNFFKIKAKKETYNDETKLKAVCAGVGIANRKMYHQHLLQELRQMDNISKE